MSVPAVQQSESAISIHISSVSSVAQSCPTLCHPWTALQASLFITISQSLLKLMSIKSVMPSNHLILCHPLLLLPSIFASIRVFPNESVLCISWPNYWSFCFISSPSNDYLGQISFRIDWFDLLAVRGTLKSLLQHHSSRVSILWHELIVWMWELDHKDSWAPKYWSIRIALLFWISFPFRSPQNTK